MSTMTSREVDRDVGAAPQTAAEGPLFITDNGETAYVLLPLREYRRLPAERNDLVDPLSMEDDSDLEVEPISLAPEHPLW